MKNFKNGDRVTVAVDSFEETGKIFTNYYEYCSLYDFIPLVEVEK